MKPIRSLIAVLISLSLIALSPGYGCYQAMANMVGAAPVTAAPGASAGVVGAVGTVGAAPAGVSPLAPMKLELTGGLLRPSMAKPELRVQPQASALPSAAPAAARLPAAAVAAQQAAAAPVGLALVTNASRAPPAAAVAPVKSAPSAAPSKSAAQVSPAQQKYFGKAAAKASEKGVKTALEGLQQPLPSSLGSMSAGQAAASLHDDFLGRIGAYEGRSFARSMPVEDGSRDSTSPDDTSGLDELGNPRRQQDPGPDSVNDYGGGGYSEDGGGRGNSELFGSLDLGAGARSFGRSFAAMARSAPFGRLLPASLSRGAAARESESRSMPSVERDRPDSSGPDDTSGLDELGNPRRQQDPGPDSVNDYGGGGYSEDGGGRGNSDLFALAAPLLGGLAVAGGLAAFTPASLMVVPLYLGIVVPSLILHEMGHALVADRLGDSTPRRERRLSFSLRGLLTHIHPIYTLALPIATMLTTGVVFGGARPVQVDTSNFRNPTRDMAKVAVAGPATNFLIAVGAAVAHAVAQSLGIGGMLPGMLAMTVMVNVMLGTFNLLPFFPLDGHHIVRYVISDVFKAPRVAEYLDSAGGLQVAALVASLFYFGGAFSGLVQAVSGFLLAAPMALAGGPSLAALAPAVAAAGLLVGRFAGGPLKPAVAPAAPAEAEHTFIVRLNGARRQLAQDMHMDLVNAYGTQAFGLQAAYQRSMTSQLEAAGLGVNALSAFGAAPVATYRRINAATLRVPESQAAAFKAALEAQGHKVYENARREIVWPIEMRPGYQKPMDYDPSARGLSMPDTLKLSTMDKVHEETRKLWGAPLKTAAVLAARSVLGLLGVDIPQPKVGVIDTGVEKEHKLIKAGLSAAKDIRPDGDGADDNGHGTWTTAMVMWFAPWLRNVTHYKAFTNGSATDDDVLKALTMAANDGNIVISNSWGDDKGDPDSPDSLLVKKMAEEGRIMVFSAGNSGWYGKNTIGNPAIVHYRDPQTKAPRVIAVAATDRNKKVTTFSSKGPGSKTTAGSEQYQDYPRKPDAAEQGADTESAWPAALGPDRVDPELGPVKSISGTSMSAPKLAGAISMLAQAFGVTKVGEDLDRIVNAVMSTLTNELGQKPEAIGDGFSAAYAAYQKLKAEGMVPVGLSRVQKAVLGITAWLKGPSASAGAGEVPFEVRIEYRELLKEERRLLSELQTGLMFSGPVWAPMAVRREAAERRMAEVSQRMEMLRADHPGLVR